jgi:hypothetical protein
LERAAQLVPLPYSERTGGTPVLNVRLDRTPPPKVSDEELATHALHHRAFRAGVLREEPRSAPVRTRPTHADHLLPAALQQPWSKDRVVEPSLFIDVEIGDGRVGQVRCYFFCCLLSFVCSISSWLFLLFPLSVFFSFFAH